MPKKKGEYSVLSEVNTEDEWLQLCKKEARETPKNEGHVTVVGPTEFYRI